MYVPEIFPSHTARFGLTQVRPNYDNAHCKNYGVPSTPNTYGEQAHHALNICLDIVPCTLHQFILQKILNNSNWGSLFISIIINPRRRAYAARVTVYTWFVSVYVYVCVCLSVRLLPRFQRLRATTQRNSDTNRFLTKLASF